jgi:DNA-binding NarL/FixJ family response regulator
LTTWESDVLQLRVTGLTLVVFNSTVRTHISRLNARLRIHNRVQATLHALRKGLCSLEVENERNART